MLRSIRAGLSTFVSCTGVVCAAVVVSAADGNAAASARDAGKRTTAGSQWTIVATYAIPEGASGLAWDGTSLYCGIYGSNGSEVYEIDPDTGAASLEASGFIDLFAMTSTVPEPSAGLLAASALGILSVLRRRIAR